MSLTMRVKRAKAEAKKKRHKRLAIFRNGADLFRIIDTMYRLFRMML